MAAHRYWRIAGISAHKRYSPLHLTQLLLVDAVGASLTVGIVPTASKPPTSGALSELEDADLTGVVVWTRPEGLTVWWDFGASPVEVTTLRFGSPAQDTSLLSARIEFSDDAIVWVPRVEYRTLVWPGIGVLSEVAPPEKTWTPHNKSQGNATLSEDRKTLLALNLQAHIKATTLLLRGVHQFEVNLVAEDHVDMRGMRYYGFGIAPENTPDTAFTLGSPALTYGMAEDGATVLMNGVTKPSVTALARNDVFGCVVDFDLGNVAFYKNGTLLISQSAPEIIGGLTPLGPHINDRSGWSARASAFKLVSEDFTYPVSGASPWVGDIKPPELGVTGGRKLQIGMSVHFFPGLESPALTGVVPINLWKSEDYLDSERTGPMFALALGRGELKGTVKVKVGALNKPIRRRVRLIRETDGAVVREVWSNAITGAYEFKFLNMFYKYTVVSYDHAHDYRAVIADSIPPELMVTT